MKALVLFLSLTCPSIACSTPTKDAAPEGVVQTPASPDQNTAVTVPAAPRAPTAFVLATPAGMTAVTEDAEGEGGLPTLRLYIEGGRTQIVIAHLSDETAKPADLLLKHAKAYRTQVAPHLPFPQVTTVEEGAFATDSNPIDVDGEAFCIAYAYRSMNELPGIVAVMHLEPGADCAALETAALATAKSLRIE